MDFGMKQFNLPHTQAKIKNANLIILKNKLKLI